MRLLTGLLLVAACLLSPAQGFAGQGWYLLIPSTPRDSAGRLTVEVAGPQQFRFDELIRQDLSARHDSREVVVDPHARYFGAELGERSLIPAGEARLGEIRFEEWLGQPVLQQQR